MLLACKLALDSSISLLHDIPHLNIGYNQVNEQSVPYRYLNI